MAAFVNGSEILSEEGVLLLDGGMGTQLQARGLQPGESTEDWNLLHPDSVREVHAAYVDAGSGVVCTNTFGANAAKYHGRFSVGEVVCAAVELARAAVAGRARVALDVGPTGRLLRPVGDFSFDAAYEAFAEEIRAGASAGADLVAIETMGDLYELKAAILAAKENCSLPVFATVALGEGGTLLTGGDVDAFAALAEGLRVDALGFNCGLCPDRMLPYLRRLAEVTSTPLIVKPNAGLPRVVDGRTVFPAGPAEFAGDVRVLVENGAAIVGGCCGTTPDHIRELARSLAGVEVAKTRERRGRCVVSSGIRALEIKPGDTYVIGERINPTGKRKLREALERGDTAYVLREAVAQAEAHADALDVNVGVPGIDEVAVLDATVQSVQGVCDLPVQIDTASPAALERALRHVNGRPLINSVNGREKSMAAVFPLAAKYGGVVVALTLDERGIPSTAEERVAVARRILERGREYGLGKDDFVIDVLCLAASADQSATGVILESLRRVRDELGCRTCLGVSNISFGLPDRPSLNAAFYTAAMAAGLSVAIMNPLDGGMMRSRRAWRALAGLDADCGEWIAMAAQAAPAATVAASPLGGREALAHAVRRGLAADAGEAASALLAGGEAPLGLIDGAIVPALEDVGRAFETGRAFLPQLLMAADAAAAAFERVRAAMKGAEERRHGPGIVLATVKGDVHDIGKNICRALLENYGFDVIDLGRDVAPEAVVEAARRSGVGVVGLSALMTTTVGAMEETIRLVHAELPGCRVVVGGAVLTPEFAARIGADAYSHDAMEMVRITTRLTSGGEAAEK